MDSVESRGKYPISFPHPGFKRVGGIETSETWLPFPTKTYHLLREFYQRVTKYGDKHAHLY